MTFILRKIRRRPNGQEVYRDKPINKAELTVGRATDCDIYLPDLRVSLNHATIENAGSTIKIQATSEKPVKFENKLGNRFTFSAKNSGNLAIGPYLLNIFKEEKDGPVIVTMERVEAKTLAVQPEDEDRLFTLKKTVLGKRSTAWILAFAAVFSFIAAPIFYFYTDRKADVSNPIEIRDDQHLIGVRTDMAWLSGEMSIAHTSLADNCNACHLNAFEATKDETCLSSGCHEGLRNHSEQEDLETAKIEPGAFGSMLRQVADFAGKPEMRCASCHMEHNGTEGVVLSFEKTCTDCHDEMDSRLKSTDLINATAFEEGKHPNFRATVVVEPKEKDPLIKRVSLDEAPISNSGLKFPHDIHLEAGGSVQNDVAQYGKDYGWGDKLECEDCHKTNASGALFIPVVMEENCGMCHRLDFDTDPVTGYGRTLRHGEPEEVVASMADFYNSSAALTFEKPKNLSGRRRPGDTAQIREEIRLSDTLLNAEERTKDKIAEIFSEGGACFDCHTIIKPEDPESVAFNIAPVSVEETFMPKAVFHHASHDNMECQDCHEAETSANATDVLLPEIDNCLECHRSEDTVNFIPSTCLMCHDYHDDTHQPFMTPSKTSRHASVWPSKNSNSNSDKASSQLFLSAAEAK